MRRLRYFHNFPISNICWPLLDLFAQLEAGKRVNGFEIDQFLLSNHRFFSNIGSAIKLANSYKDPSSRNNFTLFDIFRNKPFHNAMVKGLGSLDIGFSDVFAIDNRRINIDGIILRRDFIVENPIILYESIKSYFKQFISNLKKDPALKKKFKDRIEELFEFQFLNI